MPYKSITDLPDNLQKVLPIHGQEIYRAAFNSAYKGYKSHTDHESLCHKVAWAAVKKKYRKSGHGIWMSK